MEDSKLRLGRVECSYYNALVKDVVLVVGAEAEHRVGGGEAAETGASSFISLGDTDKIPGARSSAQIVFFHPRHCTLATGC